MNMNRARAWSDILRLGKSIYWSPLLAFLLTPLALTLFVPSSAAQGTPPPNIIIILGDDMGYGDVSFNGSPPRNPSTPNIDSLTIKGVRCSTGDVTELYCSPSRGALLTPRSGQAILRNNTPVTESAYLTDAFTREAVSFINNHAAQPFFLWLSYNAPHLPLQAPQNYLDRVSPNITDSKQRLYAAMIIALDDGIGQVLQTLQKQILINNTLIFFLSDNGSPGSPGRNLPLRGFKYEVLEGGIHVPFVVLWTGQLLSNTVFNDPVSSL